MPPVIRDPLTGQADVGAVEKGCVPRKNDPAGRRFAHDLAKPKLAVALGEVLGIGKRMLISNENGRPLKSPLAKIRPARNGPFTALGHI